MSVILDIETKTFSKKPNPEKDELRFIGFYEIEAEQYHLFSYEQKDEIQQLLNKHNLIISFNGDYYDLPIMNRFGLRANQKHIDLRAVCLTRQKQLGIDNAVMSLSNLAKLFKLEQLKQEDFDYDVLKKDSWTPAELEYIKKYTLQDIKVTYDMWVYIQDYFVGFKEFMKPDDVRQYKHITCSIGAYAYKVICYMTGMPEDYSDEEEYKKYEGGFVAEPTQEECIGKVKALDYSSAYPHGFMMGNLYSHNCKCCTQEEKWHGDEMFPISGYYCTKELGIIEKVIKKMYGLKKQYGDENKPKQRQAVKDFLNTVYGISGSMKFKSVYNLDTASDCTLIARNCIKHARDTYTKHGYLVLYSDTDSVYLLDVFDDEEKVLRIRDEIIKELKSHFPFPQDTFEMEMENRIRGIYFFKKDDGSFKKKNYVFVTEENKIKIKGLPLIKRNAAKISKVVFDKYIKPKLLTTLKIKYNSTQIKKWVEDELKNDLHLATIEWNSNEVESYKKETQIQCQISKVHGAGKHHLVPNYYYGVGLGVKYCTVKEFHEQKLDLACVDLKKAYNELQPFGEDKILPDVLVRVKGKVIARSQNRLEEWLI